MKKIVLVVVALIVSLGGLAIAQPASAAGGCGSSYFLVKQGKIVDNKNKKVGEINVYWSKKTQKNCANTQRLGKYRGHKGRTGVTIFDGVTLSTVLAQEVGNFKYQAGPVKPRVKTPGCVEVLGSVNGFSNIVTAC